MRRVVGHVLRSLLQAGARCWLETTSLLGAVVRLVNFISVCYITAGHLLLY